jgi:hypothetical protein
MRRGEIRWYRFGRADKTLPVLVLTTRTARTIRTIRTRGRSVRRCEAAELVEEVEDEDELVLPDGTLIFRRRRQHEPLAVRMQVEAPQPWPQHESAFGATG